ncbi:oligopeptide/dipeptide ABC transporter ATP-binding protein [Kiloniella antarctica]|uniref:Oligopeptide/dipeptide ABC transporter ATP-binding protein n=1 Tax=Kiloniella antarctica TaxID=1550907 RepID=A0ABW5BLE1_9PROT
MSTPLLKVENLRVSFSLKSQGDMPWTKSRTLQAVGGVNFELKQGETLGIVGESGCGKSTLARALIRMVKATGRVVWMGDEELLGLSKSQMMKYRSEIQMVFQDPLASLNPRKTVGQIIAEPLRTHNPKLSNDEIIAQVKAMMKKVSLLPNQINRYPHEFSGGQCQRIGIARALIVKPKLIICDEPVSALDVSIQAQVINLLMELQEEMGLSLVFIAHDLSVVKHISNRVMVLYLGKVMEVADRDDLYDNPRHPYTQALISAVPIPDPKIERAKDIILLEGDLPSPLAPPTGCVFRTRCAKAQAICGEIAPELKVPEAKEGEGQATEPGSTHRVACHFE